MRKVRIRDITFVIQFLTEHNINHFQTKKFILKTSPFSIAENERNLLHYAQAKMLCDLNTIRPRLVGVEPNIEISKLLERRRLQIFPGYHIHVNNQESAIWMIAGCMLDTKMNKKHQQAYVQAKTILTGGISAHSGQCNANSGAGASFYKPTNHSFGLIHLPHQHHPITHQDIRLSSSPYPSRPGLVKCGHRITNVSHFSPVM